MSQSPFYDVPELATLQDLVSYCASKYGDKTAFKLKDGKAVISYSYQDLHRDTMSFGDMMRHLDADGKHIAVVGATSYEWIVTYLGSVNAGSVIVPIDKELPLDGICDLLARSQAMCLFFDKHLEKHISEIASQVPGIKYFIAMHHRDDDGNILSFWQNIKRYWGNISSSKPALIGPDTMAAILFTSGTTGTSKGVMLSHRNIMSSTLAGAAAIQLDSNHIALSILPIHHTFEFGMGILCSMLFGVTICINDSLKNLSKNFRLFQPTMLVAVPLVLETMLKQIWFEAERKGKARTLALLLTLSNLLLKLGIDVRRKLFAEVLAAFGGRLAVIFYGGAYSPPTLVKEFNAFGIKLIQGYGITECSPLVATNIDRQVKADSVGRIASCCQVRIDDPDEKGDGEILVKGPNVMLGYYNNQAATAETFTGDWFRTGDLGHLDSDNFLYISGRIKNLIVLKNGKNVSPEEIEGYFQAISYIKELVVYAKETATGDELALLAEIYPDQDVRISMTEDAFKQKLTADIEAINRKLPIYKQVSDFILRDTEFEKTTTKKIKRFTVKKGGN
ncbi:AMP-dependent synthetase/ligase [Sporomusa malonica]|uniref:Long-chain acyl-CoA synthetase n=1 Tax=Sporomusa malonica TaxID=112901 RepID=A0A1W1ZRA9_9FIRM|nr:AMP-binding protein [Sporomusa malonica]SMC50959.1 long-chain acyl-CoA synthetase [Sporomusa malonica]